MGSDRDCSGRHWRHEEYEGHEEPGLGPREVGAREDRRMRAVKVEKRLANRQRRESGNDEESADGQLPRSDAAVRLGSQFISGPGGRR